LGSPRFVLSALATRARGLWNGGPPQSAADWFRAKYGAALANEVAIPLTEGWSGGPAAEVGPSVGDSIPGRMGQTLLLKLAGRATGRAVAIGYSREEPEGPHVWHVYPVGGVGALCQHLAAGLRDVIELESPVEAIRVDGGRAAAVRVKGRE